jgi:excisionase family DNA binding protein
MMVQVKNFEDLPAAIKVEQLAEALGISRATAFKLVKEESFPAVRVGKKRIIVPKDKLFEWLNQQAKKPLN